MLAIYLCAYLCLCVLCSGMYEGICYVTVCVTIYILCLSWLLYVCVLSVNYLRAFIIVCLFITAVFLQLYVDFCKLNNSKIIRFLWFVHGTETTGMLAVPFNSSERSDQTTSSHGNVFVMRCSSIMYVVYK